MKQLMIAPMARDDIDAAAAYIAEEQPAAARRFLRTVRRDFELICVHPEIGNLRWRNLLPGAGTIRFLPVSDFRNWLIFYAETEAHVLVIRILHGARDIPQAFGS